MCQEVLFDFGLSVPEEKSHISFIIYYICRKMDKAIWNSDNLRGMTERKRERMILSGKLRQLIDPIGKSPWVYAMRTKK